MRITTVVENDSSTKDLKSAHGLSLFIETETHRILFDLGPNGLALKNAKALGIDIDEIDYVILSHGHNDHGGGLQRFMRDNKNATIIASASVFEEHVKMNASEFTNISVKKPKQGLDRFLFVSEDITIDDTISIIASVPFQRPVIEDSNLKVLHEGRYEPDNFDHEIYLLIQEDDTVCLISGCSHKGIEHIIHSIEKTTGLTITHVVGGYHFSHYDPFNFHQQEYLHQLGQRWNARNNTRFFSCHCTGEEAFKELKSSLDDKLLRLRTGDAIII